MALYLLMTLLAITFLTLMNVGAYLGVTAKNRAMNAGDAASLAVARHQAELLNEIGRITLERMKLSDAEWAISGELADRQARICFLSPLEGIRIANETARAAGISERDAEAEKILRQHVIDIRTGYQMAVEQFPEPWPGAWEEYARELELQLGEGLLASPDGIDFMDSAVGYGPWFKYLDRQFYNAVAGRNWCWFHFNAPELVDGYSSFRDWAPVPAADERTRMRRSGNSEIHSLHLEARKGGLIELLAQSLAREYPEDGYIKACARATNAVVRLTGKTEAEVASSYVLTNRLETWYFYGEKWRKWWEIDPVGEWRFPVVGKVRPEYDVRGAAALCRTVKPIPRLLTDDGRGSAVWTAAAKPFGTVRDEHGDVARVTALGALVVALEDGGDVFPPENVRLVPLDSVGGRDQDRPNLEMVEHVRRHLPLYLSSGPSATPAGCFFCLQLREWERQSLRSEASRYLKFNSGSCVRPTGGGTEQGGTPHGH